MFWLLLLFVLVITISSFGRGVLYIVCAMLKHRTMFNVSIFMWISLISGFPCSGVRPRLDSPAESLQWKILLVSIGTEFAVLNIFNSDVKLC